MQDFSSIFYIVCGLSVSVHLSFAPNNNQGRRSRHCAGHNRRFGGPAPENSEHQTLNFPHSVYFYAPICAFSALIYSVKVLCYFHGLKGGGVIHSVK